jgi:hypothetical protein
MRDDGTDDTPALLAAYDDQMRRVPSAPLPGVVWESDGPLRRVVGHFRGFVIGPRDTGLRGGELDLLIARQRDYFAGRGESVEWKVRDHDVPPDLADRLVAAGFVPGEPQAVLVGRAADIAGEPVLPDGVTLRQVTEDAGLRRVAAMEADVWGTDRRGMYEFLAGLVGAAPDDTPVLVAEADGAVISAAWLVLRPGSNFGGLRGGTTVREWRRRGIYQALLAARARLALARGVEFLHADASPDSAPTLVRLGLRTAATATPYVWSPPGPEGTH